MKVCVYISFPGGNEWFSLPLCFAIKKHPPPALHYSIFFYFIH